MSSMLVDCPPVFDSSYCSSNASKLRAIAARSGAVNCATRQDGRSTLECTDIVALYSV